MEPIALLSMATTAFKGVQTLVKRGREIEDVAQHLGRWYGYVADINEAQQKRRRRSILDGIAVLIGIGISVAIVYGFYNLLMNYSR